MKKLTNEEKEVLRLHNAACIASGMNEGIWSVEYFETNPERRSYLLKFYRLIRKPLQADIKVTNEKLEEARATEDKLKAQLGQSRVELQAVLDQYKSFYDYMQSRKGGEAGSCHPQNAINIMENQDSQINILKNRIEWLKSQFEEAKQHIIAAFPKIGGKVIVNGVGCKEIVKVDSYSEWCGLPAFYANRGLYSIQDLGTYWWYYNEQEEKLNEKIKKLQAELAHEKSKALSSDTSMQTANDKLKVWEEEFKPLHDYILQNYTSETWGRSVPAKALKVIIGTKTKLEEATTIIKELEQARHKSFTARQAALNADDQISEVGRKAYDFLNKEPVAPVKVGDTVWSKNCYKGGRELADLHEKRVACTVKEVMDGCFYTDWFCTPRYFEDKGKTWWLEGD